MTELEMLKLVDDLLDMAMRTNGADQQLLMSAAAELAHAHRQMVELQQQAVAHSWAVNPDRMGGQFTDQEIQDAERNRW